MHCGEGVQLLPHPLALVSLGRLKPNREFYQEVSWVQQPTREEMGRHKLEVIDVSMSG